MPGSKCPDSKCHEEIQLTLKDKVSWKDFNTLKKCVGNKISKKVIWILFAIIGLPLMITGIKVWSGQETDHLRYATRDELGECEKKVTELQIIAEGQTEDLHKILNSQDETEKDVKEILRHLRDNSK